MAPRAYWKGTLKLSLVSCPVVLYPASTSVEKTRFHMINKETGNRLKQQMIDAETGDVVESDQKGRGYELKRGQYVEIEKEELEAVQIESNHTIEIDSFVPRAEIDKRYYNNPYYVAPDGKAAIDAFAVIRDAMKDEERVALARIVLTNREHVIAIEPLGKGLLGTCAILTNCAMRTTISTTSRPQRSPRTWSNWRATSCRPKRRISIPRSSRTNTRMR
jgi:Ku protein